MIVQRLRDIQNQFGFLPDAALDSLSQETGTPLARLEEVASFFPAFRQERDRPAVLEVRVCRDLTCHHLGAAALLDPETGLPQLARDDTVTLELRKNGPAWAAGASFPPPTPDLCRVAVEGVSCLGRCDRAPAVWVERCPMPAGEHAWVFARRTGEALGSFRERLETELRTIAAGGDPTPDSDSGYEPPTNADVPYALPSSPADEDLPSPGWEIDPYHNRTRRYKAVRRIAEIIKENGGPFRWPGRAELDAIRAAATAGATGAEADRLGREAVEKATRQALRDHRYLAEFRTSGLQGMGGAGVPAHTKWLDVWQQPGGEKYVVCNGDESEPGTFKDRELLLRTPHLVVEGVILAGLLTGATAGYIYIRHEYFEQIHAVREEIARAERRGACGGDVYGSGVAFPVRVVESPGGYICGEQSALLEAMEDRRAQPRNRPPELAANGLRNKPTAVNNVETLAWAPAIVIRGGAEYAAAGWRSPDDGKPAFAFKGRRLFSVSGDVRRPGVYEVPVGLPLGDLLDDLQYCGGVVGTLKAVAPSGPSSGLLPAVIPLLAPVPGPDIYSKWLTDAVARLRTPEEQLALIGYADRHLPPGAITVDIRTLPLDLNFFRNINSLLRLPVEAMLGAGVAVFADGADALDLAVNATRFFRNESCGKCVPCRIGSQKLYQIGTELLAQRDAGAISAAEVFGTAKDDPACVRGDVKLLADVLQPTSICGLGYVAPIPLNTALAYFRDDVLRKPRAD